MIPFDMKCPFCKTKLDVNADSNTIAFLCNNRSYCTNSKYNRFYLFLSSNKIAQYSIMVDIDQDVYCLFYKSVDDTTTFYKMIDDKSVTWREIFHIDGMIDVKSILEENPKMDDFKTIIKSYLSMKVFI